MHIMYIYVMPLPYTMKFGYRQHTFSHKTQYVIFITYNIVKNIIKQQQNARIYYINTDKSVFPYIILTFHSSE